MHAQHNVAAVQMFAELAHLDVDVIADGDRRFDHARAGADVAGGGERAFQRLLDSFAGDGDEAEIIKLQDLGWRAIVLQLFFERRHDAVAVLALIHVDEVDDDDAAEIAQTDLAHDLRDGVEIGLDDGVFEARGLADILAGVDVDRDEGLGLVDDNRTAGLEPDLRAQRLVDLLSDAELLEERRLLEVELDAANQRGLETLQEAQHALVLGFGVHPDGGEVVGHLVAQDALDEIEIVVDQRRRLRGLAAALDIRPEVQQEAQIAPQLFFARAFGGGAHDEATGRVALFA